jgi:hypothetical protein
MELGGLMGFWANPETRSIVQSIQTGEITIAAGTSSNTATISAVNTKYAVCFFGGWRSADTSLNTSEDYARVELTNATTVTAQTSASNAGSSRIVRYTVVAFRPFAIKSVQQGTISITGANNSATATINAVNTARAFVMHQGQNHSVHHADFNYNQGRVSLTNSTTVTANKDGTANPNLIVGYVVVEFNAYIVKSIQQLAITIAASSTTGDATISAVNDTSTLLIWGGWNVHLFATNNPSRAPYVRRTSTTNVRAVRGTTSSVATEMNCTVVEFEPRWIKSRQSGQTQITSGAATANASIATVNTALSLFSWLGWICDNISSGSDGPYTTAKINSSTQVTVERGGSPALLATNSWEIIEFV